MTTAVGLTTVYNTVVLRREAKRKAQKDMSAEEQRIALEARVQTFETLTTENARLYERVTKLDEAITALRELHERDIGAARAQIERYHGAVQYLRREQGVLNDQITAWITAEYPGSALAQRVAAGITAFNKRINEELGEPAPYPGMIGNHERKQGE